MTGAPDLADAPVITLDWIDSTNEEAVRRGRSGQCGPLWLIALAQEAGRGRSGRAWVSAPGNLFTSLLMPLERIETGPLHSFVAALALRDTFISLLPPMRAVTLKWPNDVLVEGRKIAGILLESGTGSAGRWLVVGIGANLVDAPEGTRWPSTSLGIEGGRAADAPILAANLRKRFAHWAGRLAREGFAPVREAWLASAAMRGETIEVRLPDRTLRGRFDGIDGDGALLLGRAGSTRRILAGDVFADMAAPAAAP